MEKIKNDYNSNNNLFEKYVSLNAIQKMLNKKVIQKLRKGKTYTVKVTYLKDTIKTTVKVK